MYPLQPHHASELGYRYGVEPVDVGLRSLHRQGLRNRYLVVNRLHGGRVRSAAIGHASCPDYQILHVVRRKRRVKNNQVFHVRGVC